MFLTELLPAAIKNNPKVFQPVNDCRGKWGINGMVKVLLPLDVLCFGNIIYKELPLYQMGESTAHTELKAYCQFDCKMTMNCKASTAKTYFTLVITSLLICMVFLTTKLMLKNSNAN